VPKYSAVEKKIARVLNNLPTESLGALIKTEDQLINWLAHRKFRIFAAQCWRALHKGDEDPLRALLESREIDRSTYEHVWLTVDFYERLWELVQVSFYYVQPELENYGLSFLSKSAAALFSFIVLFEANADFFVCLKPYHECSSGKQTKNQRLAKKVLKGEAKPHELRQLKGLNDKNEFNLPLFITLAISQEKATRKEPVLKAKLEAFNVALFKLSDCEATACRKAGSFAWNKGEMIRAKRGGSYAKDA